MSLVRIVAYWRVVGVESAVEIVFVVQPGFLKLQAAIVKRYELCLLT